MPYIDQKERKRQGIIDSPFFREIRKRQGRIASFLSRHCRNQKSQKNILGVLCAFVREICFSQRHKGDKETKNIVNLLHDSKH